MINLKESHFLSFIFLCCLFSSCAKEASRLDVLTPAELAFSAGADSYDISFDTNNEWTASTSASWIVVGRHNGSAGTVALNVTIAENTAYEGRVGAVLIRSKELTETVSIRQEAAKGIVISQSQYEIGPSGGEVSIPLKTNVEYECAVDGDAAGWLRIVSTRALKVGEIVAEVSAYEGFLPRRGRVRIYGEGVEREVEIVQTAPDAIFLDKESYTLYGDAAVEMKISSNIPVTVTSSASWLSLSIVKVEDGFVVTMRADENPTSKERKAEITVSGGSIVRHAAVTQTRYASSDYSADGIVKVWNRTSTGRGGNFVIMGDGFSDRMIADGSYDDAVRRTVDAIFAKEPYLSLRDLLNVYSVNVVSKNEGIGSGIETALGSYFYADRMVDGNLEACVDYACKAVDEDKLDETVVVVVLNSTKYGGIANWFEPERASDCADGLCVAFFTMNSYFVELLQHEACGHGFAKLADEYEYYYSADENNVADYNRVSRQYERYAKMGWYRNIDYRSDPSLVKWSRFIADPRYAAEKIGVFEGADYYTKGSYRATSNSIMRALDSNDYNAPAREAIYYRINRLYYGDGWQYDYETFVQQDLGNIKAHAAPAATRAILPEWLYTPPRVIEMPWREYLGGR